MSSLKPWVQHSMQCSAASEVCVKHGPGHAMSPVQLLASGATPSKWRDAIVASAASDGWIALDLVDSDERVWVWNHEDLGEALVFGEPVALHAVYSTLALGAERISVVVATTP
ncbi:hypothetical protein [Luethyella okanaganae]|uniref:Uncharacterized protein n=1 Tax=Luethyella okanaganae TaxID=69372 RepID=A0ABW1VKJ3_9MICO